MLRKCLFLLATSGLLALASCGVPRSSTGELNNGRFSYLCVDSSDGACDGALGNLAIPDLIAVGGAFDVEYAGESEGSSPVQVQPASETMISAASGKFKFLAPGISAVLARNTSGGVADFVHLRAANIDHLDVAGPSSTDAVDAVELTTSKTVTLEAAPKAQGGIRLAGALAYTWSSSDATIVAVDTAGARRRATLTGLAAGTATVEVSAPGGFKTAVQITVKKGSSTTTSSSSTSGAGGAGGGTMGAGGAGGGQ